MFLWELTVRAGIAAEAAHTETDSAIPQ